VAIRSQFLVVQQLHNQGTASGFGATGAASWNTTVKTTDFTAVAGEGYFVNTTSGGGFMLLYQQELQVQLLQLKIMQELLIQIIYNNFKNGSDKIGGS
jgi:hypothetical protein